jgi:hypothetical protein
MFEMNNSFYQECCISSIGVYFLLHLYYFGVKHVRRRDDKRWCSVQSTYTNEETLKETEYHMDFIAKFCHIKEAWKLHWLILHNIVKWDELLMSWVADAQYFIHSQYEVIVDSKCSQGFSLTYLKK